MDIAFQEDDQTKVVAVGAGGVYILKAALDRLSKTWILKSHPIIEDQFISRIAVIKKGATLCTMVIANDLNCNLSYLKVNLKENKIVQNSIIFNKFEDQGYVRGLKVVPLLQNSSECRFLIMRTKRGLYFIDVLNWKRCQYKIE